MCAVHAARVHTYTHLDGCNDQVRSGEARSIDPAFILERMRWEGEMPRCYSSDRIDGSDRLTDADLSYKESKPCSCDTSVRLSQSPIRALFMQSCFHLLQTLLVGEPSWLAAEYRSRHIRRCSASSAKG